MNEVILLAYLAVFLFNMRAPNGACLAAFFAVFISQLWITNKTPNDLIILNFCMFVGIYTCLSCALAYMDRLLSGIIAVIIALHSLAYAIDIYAFPTTETWLYKNHEIIVCILHAMLICVSIPKFNTILSRFWHNSIRVFNSMLCGNPANDGNSRKAGEGKA